MLHELYHFGLLAHVYVCRSLTLKTFIFTALVAYLGLALTAFIYVPFGEGLMRIVQVWLFQGVVPHTGEEMNVNLNETSEAATKANFWDIDGSHAETKLNPGRLKDQLFTFLVTNQIGESPPPPSLSVCGVCSHLGYLVSFHSQHIRRNRTPIHPPKPHLLPNQKEEIPFLLLHHHLHHLLLFFLPPPLLLFNPQKKSSIRRRKRKRRSTRKTLPRTRQIRSNIT